MSSDVSNRWQSLGHEQRLHDLEALTQVANQINRSLDPENVLATSLKGVQSVLDADFGCFVLVNPDNRALELERVDDVPVSLRTRLEEFALHFSPQIDISQTETRIQIVSEIGLRLNAVLDDDGIVDSMLIPLLTRNRLVGIMLFGISKGKLLAPKSVDLLMSIGDQVAMAIENALLHAAVSESEKWHRAFIESSPDAIWESNASGKTTFVNDAACKIFGYDRATFLTLGINDLIPSDLERRRVTRTRLLEQGYLSNIPGRIRTRTGEIRSMGYTIRVIRDPEGNFAGYQAIFRDITEQMRVLENLEQRNQELAALNSIATIFSNPLEIHTALEQVCKQIVSITGMQSVAIYLKEEAGKSLNLLAHHGVSDTLIAEARSLGLDDPVTRQVGVNGESIVISDVTLLADGFAGPRADGYIAGIGVPLRKRGVPVGVVWVGSKTRRDFGSHDVELMQNISQQIGVALDNADLYAQMQRRMHELDGLAKLGAACSGTLDPLALSQVAVDWVHKLLQPHFAIIRFLEDNRMRLAASRVPSGVFLNEYMEVDEVFAPIVRELIPLTIPNIETSNLPLTHRQGFLSVGMRALTIVPMSARDRVIGAMAMAYQEPHAWQSHEMDLLQTIANQVAGAIDSARLFQNVLSEQRKVQAIFDSGLSGLFATDAQGRIVMFNRAAERMTGWTLNEIRGFTWQEIFSDPSAIPPIEPLINEALLRKKTVFAHEARPIRTRDGRVIPVAKAVAPLLDDNDNVTGAVGAFWDLSREQAAELERNELLRFAAHQIRSPLTALLSALELFARPNLTEDRRVEMWKLIMSQGERLRRFASQFLDFEAVVKSGRSPHWEPVPIVSTIRALIKDFRANAGKHIFVIKSVKPEPMVHADLDHLQHILRNLIDNAVTYSPRGSRVTITVRCPENDKVEVRVKDQGPGIPLAEQEKIFKPFYRSPNVEGRYTYSHGLGLAIARGLVKEMGGDIWVISEMGRGATFHFTLRRYR